jgi:hypothetical protein
MMNEVPLREYCNSATPGNYGGDEPCHPLRNTGNGATLDRVTATPIRAKSLRHRDLEEAGAGPCREGRHRDLDQKLVVAERRREGTRKKSAAVIQRSPLAELARNRAPSANHHRRQFRCRLGVGGVAATAEVRCSPPHPKPAVAKSPVEAAAEAS